MQYHPCRLFVSPCCSSRALSVTAVLFLLRVGFLQPVLQGFRLAPFTHMGSVASPPLWPSLELVVSCVFFSLCFLCFFVLCVSQPKKSRGVMLYGHVQCRVPWVPPEFVLALSRTLSLRSDL